MHRAVNLLYACRHFIHAFFDDRRQFVEFVHFGGDAVKPARVGLERWPDVPRGIDIKHGTLDALGWPHADQRDIAMGWKRILSTVRTYRDLEPALLGRVEELIDFVTVPWAQ